MHRRRRVATLVFQKMSRSNKLQRLRLGDLRKVWLFSDLDAHPGNSPSLVLSRLFVVKNAFHIGIAVWPFANRPFSDDGFVMSNLKGLTLDMTFIVWPTK